MFFIFVTEGVIKFDKFIEVNNKHPLNIFSKLVTIELPKLVIINDDKE